MRADAGRLSRGGGPVHSGPDHRSPRRPGVRCVPRDGVQDPVWGVAMRPNRMKRYSLVFCAAVSLCFAPAWAAEVARIPPLGLTIESVQPRMVKLYGAGGFRGLEAYQSGF